MSLRDLRRQAGRLVVAGFAGHSAPDDLRRLIAEFDLAGVILFARNVAEPRQVAELCREVASLSGDWPLWISVDQEGGRVARLKSPFTVWPPAITLGRSGDEQLALRFAHALATELAAVGITLDFAPVLDVRSNPASAAIGDRALSDDPAVAARIGAVIIRGLQERGITACGKHFPGHGDTAVDSHDAAPVVGHDLRRLEAVEFVPFRRAIAEGVASIMIGHLNVLQIDPDRIASLSPVVTTLLKQGLGFGGVVFSDDLGMKAVSDTTPLPEATVAAIQAGCDAALLCNSTTEEQWLAIEAVIRAAEDGEIAPSRIDDALLRQRRVKERFASVAPGPIGAVDRVGGAEHLAIAREMAAWQ